MTISQTVRFEVGRLTCIAIKDGTGQYPPAMFLTNLAREAGQELLLRQRGEDPEQKSSCLTAVWSSTPNPNGPLWTRGSVALAAAEP